VPMKQIFQAWPECSSANMREYRPVRLIDDIWAFMMAIVRWGNPLFLTGCICRIKRPFSVSALVLSRRCPCWGVRYYKSIPIALRDAVPPRLFR
jgi:hypothetical protein